MIKADLITGFLGAGKTTFIVEYAGYFISQGIKTAVIVNDFGAINVDRIFLEKRLGGLCDIEMVIGGDRDCAMRRLKTKLIALAMDRYERVIIEPSGVFEADDFLDLIYDDPLGSRYEPGSIITLVDAETDRSLSRNAKYVLASQLTKAGKVVISKAGQQSSLDGFTEFLNDCLAEFGSKTGISSPFVWKKGETSPEEFEMLSKCGYKSGDIIKLPITENGSFTSLFFFHVKIDVTQIEERIARIFKEETEGTVYRIKGFLALGDGWLEINATKNNVNISESEIGQELFIVIGEGIDKEKIGRYWDSYNDEVQA